MGVGGDADEVYRAVEIDLLDDFVGVGHGPVAGGVGREEGHRELGEADQAAVADEAGGFGFGRGGLRSLRDRARRPRRVSRRPRRCNEMLLTDRG